MMPCGSRMPESAAPGPRTVVVSLPGEVDSTNKPQVQAVLADALASGAEVVVIDGTATRFCDSAAIALLIRAHRDAAAAGAQLRVVVNSTPVLRALALTGADSVLQVHSSLATAHPDRSDPPPPAAA